MRHWTRGDVVIVAAGVLLALDLLTLPWHHYRLDTAELGIDMPAFNLERTGVQSPQAALGIAAVAIALGMAAHTLLAKLTSDLPRLEQVHLVAGAVVLGRVLAKLLANRDFLGAGAWVGTALACALAYGGFALSLESDGRE
jgi:hypothetical protein